MLKLKKKGKRLGFDPENLRGIRGGFDPHPSTDLNCGQGCDNTCGTGTKNVKERRIAHDEWKRTPW